jgi:hypothetical protein
MNKRERERVEVRREEVGETLKFLVEQAKRASESINFGAMLEFNSKRDTCRLN